METIFLFYISMDEFVNLVDAQQQNTMTACTSISRVARMAHANEFKFSDLQNKTKFLNSKFQKNAKFS